MHIIPRGRACGSVATARIARPVAGAALFERRAVRRFSAAIGWALWCWLLTALPATADGITRVDLRVADGVEVPVSVYAAEGKFLALWLPSEAGEADGEARVAAGLAARGVEVWRADLLTARMLPAVRSAMAEIPAADVAALIEQAADGKRVVVVSSGLGAGPALRGALAWRAQTTHRGALLGLVLLHPDLYVGTPEPGVDARYLPEVARSDFKMVVLQPDRSPLYWYLDRLDTELKRGGNRVLIERLSGVRDRFHFRPDATAAETTIAAGLPTRILTAIEQMDSWRK